MKQSILFAAILLAVACSKSNPIPTQPPRKPATPPGFWWRDSAGIPVPWWYVVKHGG